jgi:uncharacterized RDD family membrane protein YckC
MPINRWRSALSRMRDISASAFIGGSSESGASHDADDDEHATSVDREATTALTVDYGEEPQTSARREALQADQAFGPYRICRLLGKGGMGEVYEAEHVDSGRRVALKVLGRSLGSAATARFLREGRLAASVSHPNSVYVFGSEQIDGRPVIVMELVAGGTLQEIIERRGRMTVERAVDATLQIIAGLEAAEAAGVLHRDIKPSNCFVGADDSVKVGDFGLSRSTMGAHQTRLTTTGTFLGTPTYASPEQVRGDALDVRSDIYAVGATLYYLLTGRTLFKGKGVMHVLSAVLQQEPESPSQVVPDIPETLAQVVLRCLRKNAASRYATYAELSAALLPFSSAPATAARLRLRFLAYVVDTLILTPIYFGAGAALGFTLTDPSLTHLSAGVDLLYFGVLEGLWGASIGKRLFGLRVVGPHRSTSLPLAFARAFVLVFLLSFSILVIQMAALESTALYVIAGVSQGLMAIVIFAPARKRNGFAGIHDLISNTRVVTRPGVPVASDHGSKGLMPRSVSAGRSSAGRVGPYTIVHTAVSSPGSNLLVGYDEVLRRSVWIERVSIDHPRLSRSRQAVARATRLRWLASRRAVGDAWDAYEAAEGCAVSGGQAWTQVRGWILMLIQEIRAGLEDGTLPKSMSIANVWIDEERGGVRVLDFAAPGATIASGSHAVRDAYTAQFFLHAVALAALEPTPGAGLGRVALPLAVRGFLAQLGRSEFATLDELAQALRELLEGVTAVSRARRIAGFAPASFLPAIMLSVGLAFGYTNYMTRRDPTIDRLDLLTTRLQRLEASDGQSPEQVRAREALRIYIGDRYQTAIADPASWVFRGTSSAALADRATAEDARTRAQAADPAAREQAARDAADILADVDRRASSRLSPVWSMVEGMLAMMTIGIAMVGVVSIVLSAIFRVPPGLRLMGLALASVDGQRVSRLRATMRGVVAWSPCVAVLVVMGVASSASMLRAIDRLMLWTVADFVFVAGLVWTVARPERGPHDHIVATRVVPR